MAIGFLQSCFTWRHSGAMIINLFTQKKNHFLLKKLFTRRGGEVVVNETCG